MFFCVSHVDNTNISSHFMTCVMGQKGRKREREREREEQEEREERREREKEWVEGVSMSSSAV
jgi:hypothetical protein